MSKIGRLVQQPEDWLCNKAMDKRKVDFLTLPVVTSAVAYELYGGLIS